MPNRAENELFCAIDLGSNSFHMAIAHACARSDRLKKILSMSEKVQLGAGLDEHGYLSLDAQERGLACLTRFVGRLDGIAAERLRVVATNTFRQATNRDEFIRKAAQILPCPIEIISGREEARLIYLGVANTDPSPKKRLVVDIGGGSTELIIGQENRPILTESAQMGAVSFTQKFFKDGSINRTRFEDAIEAATKEIIQHAKRYHKNGFEQAVGSSGTIKAVFTALTGLGLVRGQSMTVEAVQALKNHLLATGHTAHITLEGVKTHRQAIFPAGVAVLLAVMQVFSIKSMIYSDGALREGVMYDLRSRLDQTDARDEGVMAFADKFYADKKQAKRVAKTARQLSDALFPVIPLSPSEQTTLKYAAWLHEIGMSIGHSSYHHHSAYILQFGEIAGFSKPEQERLAGIVRYHRRKITAADRQNLIAVGGSGAVTLALLLRLAATLHHSRTDLHKSAFQLQPKSAAHWILTVKKDPRLVGLNDEIAHFQTWGVVLEILAC